MCGILGIVNFNKNKEYPKPSVRFLLNRGPDGVRQYSDENITLYHTRLAVIDDRETSNQPIINGDFVLVCNGEIYNYDRIKENGNYRYSTTSDCEAIIHIYKLFGMEGLKYLDGTFSFALYDKKNSKLILHRDNVGKKPLYFLADDNNLIFASNITAIADNYIGKLNINRNQIEFYLKNGFISPQETFFKEIKPVFPGEVYEIDLVSKKIKKSLLNKECRDYSNFDFSDSDLIQQKIEELISEAVFKRIKNIKEPVLLFSGGVDSTVLAHFMLKLNKKTRLISLKQPISFLYDEPYIKYASGILNKEIISVDIFNKSFYKKIDLFIKNIDQPLSLYSYYFLSALCLRAKEFGKVLFTGDGGDELFLGYGKIDDWFSEEERKTNDSIIFSGPTWEAPLSIYALKVITIDLIGHGFVKIDKAIAENEMEARCPFLDWDLMCFVRKIPLGYWKKFNIPKYPIRILLLKKGFSKRFVYRKKIGFFYPFRYIMVFKYPYMADYLNKNLSIAKDYLKIEIDKPSVVGLFKNFNFYWNIFVFLKFIENNKLIL